MSANSEELGTEMKSRCFIESIKRVEMFRMLTLYLEQIYDLEEVVFEYLLCVNI